MNSKSIGHLHFLIVEDDRFQREALEMLLTNLGAQNVSHAEDGKVALDVLSTSHVPIDIVLCDLDMPQMDGMAFLRNLAKTNNQPAVILSSGLGGAMMDSVEAMAKAYELNVLGTMAKPPSRSRFLALINDLKGRGTGSRSSNTPITFSQHEIAHALKNGEFIPYFQPKVAMDTGQVVGMEALVRWNSPVLGLLPPSAFLAQVELYGLMDHLTWIMLAKSATTCRRWHDNGLALSVSVNLSLSSLGRIELAERIDELVRKRGLSPTHMILEVTETAAMSAVGPSLENLTRLRLRGFGLSIDDYGTGYSSLQQLTRVPFTELKIDQSFVKDALRHDATRIVVESSLDIARKLGLKVTAEGIETYEHWQLLSKMGCDIAQGYLIAKPMPEDVMLTWLGNWSLSSIQRTEAVSRPLHILLVEDEDFQRETYGELLEQLGLGRVQTASNVDEALSRLEAASFDLVISDVGLGERSGLDLVRLIRARQTRANPATRIVLLSSSSEQNVVIQSIELDINGFVVKPANLRVLHEAILQALLETFEPQSAEAYLKASSDAPQPPHVSATISRTEAKPGVGRTTFVGEQMSLLSAKAGMVLAEPIYSRERVLVLGRGKSLTQSIINRLLDIRDELASADITVLHARTKPD